MTPRCVTSMAGAIVVLNMFWVKVGGDQELPSGPQCGRLHLYGGNFSLYRSLCAVLTLCFHGFRLWGNFLRAQFSSVP